MNNKIYYKKKKRIREIDCTKSISILSDFSTKIPINCYESTLPSNFHLAIAGQSLIAFKKEYYRGAALSFIGSAILLYGAINEEDVFGIAYTTILTGNIMTFLSFINAGEAGKDLIEAADITRYNESSEKIE